MTNDRTEKPYERPGEVPSQPRADNLTGEKPIKPDYRGPVDKEHGNADHQTGGHYDKGWIN